MEFISPKLRSNMTRVSPKMAKRTFFNSPIDNIRDTLRIFNGMFVRKECELSEIQIELPWSRATFSLDGWKIALSR